MNAVLDRLIFAKVVLPFYFISDQFFCLFVYAGADDAVAAHYRTIDRRDKFRKAEDCPRIKLLASGRRLLGYSERKYLQKGKMTQN